MRNGKMNYLKRCVLGTLVFLLSSTLCTKAQNLSVSGTVTDDTGQPVIGASVKVPGSSVGTITDMDGNFTISVPKDTKLEVSYVGYKNRIVTASSSNLVIKSGKTKCGGPIKRNVIFSSKTKCNKIKNAHSTK